MVPSWRSTSLASTARRRSATMSVEPRALPRLRMRMMNRSVAGSDSFSSSRVERARPEIGSRSPGLGSLPYSLGSVGPR